MNNYKHVEKIFKILSDPATGLIVGSRLECSLIENADIILKDYHDCFK